LRLAAAGALAVALRRAVVAVVGARAVLDVPVVLAVEAPLPGRAAVGPIEADPLRPAHVGGGVAAAALALVGAAARGGARSQTEHLAELEVVLPDEAGRGAAAADA